MRRVLALGSRLLFSEQGIAPDKLVQCWQRRLQPLWGRLGGGCQIGRDIPAILMAAGFEAQARSGYIPGRSRSVSAATGSLERRAA
jgi:hypothetical protein